MVCKGRKYCTIYQTVSLTLNVRGSRFLVHPLVSSYCSDNLHGMPERGWCELLELFRAREFIPEYKGDFDA
jgi:hypothetical protein